MTTPTTLQQQIWNLRTNLRDPLAERYRLFVHETNHSSVECIARTALEARNPGTAEDDSLIVALGHLTRRMVCLHPLESSLVGGSKAGPFSLLAVLPDSLPAELTLDWSFSGNWSLPDIIRTSEPAASPTELFLRTVQMRGSVAALNNVPSRQIFVLCGEEPTLLWRPLLPLPEDILVYPTTRSQHTRISAMELPDASMLQTDF